MFASLQGLDHRLLHPLLIYHFQGKSSLFDLQRQLTFHFVPKIERDKRRRELRAYLTN